MAGGGGPAEQGTPDSRKSLRIRNLPPDHQVVKSGDHEQICELSDVDALQDAQA